MVHGVGGEGRSGIGVAIAALNASHRDMRRRGVAGRRRAVVAARAIGVCRPMRIGRIGKCDRARMAAFAGEVRGNVITGLA